jgi:hypothetical protein
VTSSERALDVDVVRSEDDRHVRLGALEPAAELLEGEPRRRLLDERRITVRRDRAEDDRHGRARAVRPR